MDIIVKIGSELKHLCLQYERRIISIVYFEFAALILQ